MLGYPAKRPLTNIAVKKPRADGKTIIINRSTHQDFPHTPKSIKKGKTTVIYRRSDCEETVLLRIGISQENRQ